MKGTYLFDYVNENEFKKLERSLKKYLDFFYCYVKYFVV